MTKGKGEGMTSRAMSFLLRDVGRNARPLAREADVQNARLVAQRVAMDAERIRGASQISRRALDRSDDVLLLELLLGEIETDAVREKLVDDDLKLSVEIHIFSRDARMQKLGA